MKCYLLRCMSLYFMAAFGPVGLADDIRSRGKADIAAIRLEKFGEAKN
jgi:hypothetical protein